MKTHLKSSFLCVLAALALPLSAFALDKGATAPPATEEKGAVAAGNKVPYHGKIASVDAAAKTFTIKGKDKDRVFAITEGTKITRDNAPVDLGAIAPGDEVRGQATKDGDHWAAVSVMTGTKAEMKAETKGKKGAEKAEPAAPEAKK